MRPAVLYRAGLTDRNEECDIIMGDLFAYQLLLHDDKRRRWMVDVIPLTGWVDQFIEEMGTGRR